MTKLYKVEGYYKDDGTKFKNFLVTVGDEQEDIIGDDHVFFNFSSEEELESNKTGDDGEDFVITSYTRLRRYVDLQEEEKAKLKAFLYRTDTGDENDPDVSIEEEVEDYFQRCGALFDDNLKTL